MKRKNNSFFSLNPREKRGEKTIKFYTLFRGKKIENLSSLI